MTELVLPREIIRMILKMRAYLIVRSIPWRRFTKDSASAAWFNRIRLMGRIRVFSFDRSTWKPEVYDNETTASIIRHDMYEDWMDAWNSFFLYKKKRKIK